jgi:hypothetical protein
MALHCSDHDPHHHKPPPRINTVSFGIIRLITYSLISSLAMIRENRQLVTDEPVEFEK